MKVRIGIDPGVSGAMAVSIDGEVSVYPFSRDLADELLNIMTLAGGAFAVLEAVHSMPGQGVASTFKFGKNAGWWEGVLDYAKIPYLLVRPQEWQRGLGLPKEKNKSQHKRNLKDVAGRMFPAHKPTLKTCDALLILNYCRSKNR